MSQQQHKRKKDGASEEMTGREKKKVRMAEARTIPVQTAGAGSSTQTGPSKVVPMNSLKGLPSAIDIEKVVESRAFEIGAMQTAMKTASAGCTQRAWQQLPRHLRRRAASHDVRRVPQRLRGRALQEMDALPPKKKGIPRRGKANQESRTESFLRRQKDKTWLETHIWHAKRMHMKDMWGYRIAVKPTEKSYRPSYRASIQGAIIHDASYYSLIELRGASDTIVGVLNQCCDPQGASLGTVRFTNGARTRETHIYEAGSFPYGLISPISILWHPLPEAGDAKGKGKESATASADAKKDRVVWLRFHPAVHYEVLSSLQKAAQHYLAGKKAEGFEDVELQICDLKDQINVFEIMGPQSSQVIRGALSAVPGDKRPEFKEFWSSLGDLQTAGSVPRNTVVGFKVLDPRLRFPPKRATPKPDTAAASGHIFPSVSLARSEIWDEKTRLGLAKPKYSKKELDERRSKNPVPGTPLAPQRRDDRVPILLIQRSTESPRSSSGQAIHGWILVVPSGWGMAFFSSLVFTGARVAGQRERHTQYFEAGTTHFPTDYPSTKAYEVWAREREEERRRGWERKPPAKRTNWKKKGVRDPYAANFDRILGIEEDKEDGEEDVDLVSAQREPEPMAVVETEKGPNPWLLRGLDTGAIVETLLSRYGPENRLKVAMNALRMRRGMQPLSAAEENLRNGALVNVKVNVCKRGLPDDLALICALDSEELNVVRVSQAQKEPKTGRGEQSSDRDDDEQLNASLKTSKDAELIGRVTTGNYSLSMGKGHAVGVVPLTKYLELLKQQPGSSVLGHADQAPLVKIRNTNSDQYRLARLELMVEGDD